MIDRGAPVQRPLAALPAESAAVPTTDSPATRDPRVERRAKVVRRLSRWTEILLWCVFLTSMVRGLLAPTIRDATPSTLYRLVNAGGWLWPVLLMLLVLLNAGLVVREGSRYGRAVLLLYGLLLYSAVEVPIGLLQGGDTREALAYHLIPYGSALLAFLGGACPSLPDRLLRSCTLQLPIAAAYTAAVLVLRPVSSRDEFVYAHDHAYQLLSTLALLGPLVGGMRFSRQVGYLVAFAAMMLLNVYGQNRLALVSFGLLLPFLAIVMNIRSLARLARLGVAALVVLPIALAVLPLLDVQDQLDQAWKGTVQRFFYSADMRDASLYGLQESMRVEYEQSRGAEAIDFIESAEWWVWLIGKGFGTSWYSNMRHMDWPMVHFGPLNLVFRGGLGFMLLFLAVLAVALRNSWRSRHVDVPAAGYFSFVAVWTIGFLSHGPLPVGYSTYVFWLVIGCALAGRDAGRPRARA